jgi:hypothetical protein
VAYFTATAAVSASSPAASFQQKTFEVVGNILASVKKTKGPSQLPASFLLGTWQLSEQRYLDGSL